MPVTVRTLAQYKARGERFSMVTAYDFTSAKIAAEADIPVLLVGDSLGMTMLGYSTTVPVSMDELLHHARAVARGAPERLLVGDLPFGTYHASEEQAIANAVRVLQAGLHGVKVEGGGRVVRLTELLCERGIPVMGHLGLTPQFVNAFGGHRVQGREQAARERIGADALALQEAGAFAIVLEGVPRALAAQVTEQLSVPTIGIGAGPDCDGQVLVWHDLLGLTRGRVPSFVKAYASLGDTARDALASFATEVREGSFPDDAHSYS
ncbi:MAG: 3-methyl-2-oxobutanoate hydroxymethyltransferase [Candidatus Dormibacteria bacterium]